MRMRFGRMAMWLTGMLLLVSSGLAMAQTLRAEVALTDAALSGPPAGAPVLRRVHAADDGTLRLALPRRPTPYWVRLTLDPALATGSDYRLVIEGPRTLAPVVFYPPGAAPTRMDGQSPEPRLMRQGWALKLPEGWPASSVAWLQVRLLTTEPLRLRVASADALAREQREQARSAMVVFTVLLLMAVAILAVYVVFRDLLYLSYAGYVTCMALYTVLLSGDAPELPLLSGLADYGVSARWGIPTLAVTLQLVFTRRILELDRLLPRAARLVGMLFWIHVLMFAALLLGRELVHDWYYLVGNTLLLTCAPIVLALPVLALRQGAAYARLYLLGWAPLVLVVALTAADQLALVDAPWASRVLPWAAVLECAVLALALSRHAAHRHRIALLARQSHGRDPLTGALNGESLVRMLEAWHQLGSLGARGYCLLMVDLDNFSELNTRHGRAVGDAVLQQVLMRVRALVRPEDIIGRLDGDSFAIVSECDRADGEPLARRVADALSARPFRIDGDSISITASVGLAFATSGEPVQALMRRARDALTRAHRVSCNAVSVAGEARVASHPPAPALVDT